MHKILCVCGDIVKVEKLNATGSVEFDQVLMVGDKIGTPYIDGAEIAQAYATLRKYNLLGDDGIGQKH